MIDAHVDGRPMPSSSSRLTRLASVYRAGGTVVWPPGVSDWTGTACPTVSAGSSASRSVSAPALSSVDSTYACRYPGKLMVVPLAANSQSVLPASVALGAPSRTLTVVPVASAICEANVRCQIRR